MERQYYFLQRAGSDPLRGGIWHLVGLVNGAVITRFGVAPFICTLGMMYVARGSALLFNDGSTYPNLNGMETLGNTGFATLSSGTFLGIYLPIWLMIGFFDFRLLDHD